MGYIYKIENQLNHHVYIGQTSRTIEQRWREHLNKKNEGCSALQRAFKKYGISNFTVEMIEECDDKVLNDREIWWIKYYDSYYNGYNLTLGGEQGFKYDSEEIVKTYINTKSISKVCKIVGCSHNTVINTLEKYGIKREQWEIKVQAINPENLKVEQEFETLTEAAKAFNGNAGTISAALNGKRKTAYGYFWKKSNEEKDFSNISMNSNRTNQIIIQLDKNTEQEIKRYNSIAEANRALGVSQYSGSISNVIAGKAKTAHGFKWKREYKYKLGEDLNGGTQFSINDSGQRSL